MRMVICADRQFRAERRMLRGRRNCRDCGLTRGMVEGRGTIILNFNIDGYACRSRNVG
jgi:ribosomal protein S14